MRIQISWILLVGCLTMAPGVEAQMCTPDRTPTLKDCKDEVERQLASESAPRATEVSEDEQLAENKAEISKLLLSKLPPEIAALPGASSTVEDFLSKLKISATTTDLAESGGTAVAVELTDFLGLRTDDSYKVQAVLRPPELAKELADQLPEDVAKSKGGELDDFDDVLVSFSYAPTVGNLGRVDAALKDAIKRNLNLKRLRDEFFRLEADFILEMSQLPTGLVKDGKDEEVRFETVPEMQRSHLLETAEAYYKADEMLRQATSNLLRGSRFFLLADLVANQPQLVISASRSFRERLVGPEETTAKITYEMGFVNLNGLRRHAREHCTGMESELACLDSFLTPGRRSRLEKANRGDRLTFSFEWSRRQGLELSVGDTTIDFERRERWTTAFAYGRNLRVEANGKASLRADLTASWEDWSDDPMHQDRALVKLALSQRITDDASAVIGAVWASRPELRGDVDKEFSARFGLTFSLDSKKK